MRRLLAIAVPAVLLVAPATAPAKGIMGATVCGADGCEKVANPDHGMLGGGAVARAPARPEPFVRFNVRVGVPEHVERVSLLFLPRSGLVLAEGATTWMHALRPRELRAIARRVTPLPASRLPDSAPLGAAAAKAAAGAGAPLPAEVWGATESTRAAAGAGDGGWDARWLALPVAAMALAAGFVRARRRHRDPAARAVSTAG